MKWYIVLNNTNVSQTKKTIWIIMKGITRKRRNVYINCLEEVECYYYWLLQSMKSQTCCSKQNTENSESLIISRSYSLGMSTYA